jgi:DNA-binding transcriptional ArsR family regulator
MADADEERKRRKAGGKKARPVRRKGSLSEKTRKARALRRRQKPDGRRRANMIWAIAHPLRRRILRVIADNGEPLTPTQIATALGLPVGTVTYHSNVLRGFGAVEPVGKKSAGGTVERLYDSTIEDDPPIETLLEETREVDDEDA